MAFIARKYGIEVPIITCWTDESRNVETGILNGVVDMVNSYPRWQIEKNLGRLVDLQMKTQPGKPLISGELQGGWCCELGWQLSWKQDGLPPVQTQNITLYTLQRGFSALNFYMAVGGTNFDDWAARQQVTSYDYAAAIGEDGVVNERYRRFQGLSTFIDEHGTRIARADLVSLDYITTDTLVKLALRCAKMEIATISYVLKNVHANISEQFVRMTWNLILLWNRSGLWFIICRQAPHRGNGSQNFLILRYARQPRLQK